MSYVALRVDVNFTFQNIRTLLEKGQALGYRYEISPLVRKDNSTHGASVTIDEMLIYFEDARNRKQIFPILTFIDNTNVNVHFIKSEGLLSVMFSSLGGHWSTMTTDGVERVNVQKYALTLLNLVKGYKVIDITIATD